MRVFVFSVLIAAVLSLSATTFEYLRVFGIRPDFIALIIISYAVLRGDNAGALMGFFAGLTKDIMFGDTLGLSAMLYAVLGYVCGKPFRDFFPENNFLPLMLSAFGSLLLETMFFFFTYLFRGETDFLYYFNRRILPAAIYTSVFAIPVYHFVYFINKWLEPWDTPGRSFF